MNIKENSYVTAYGNLMKKKPSEKSSIVKDIAKGATSGLLTNKENRIKLVDGIKKVGKKLSEVPLESVAGPIAGPISRMNNKQRLKKKNR